MGWSVWLRNLENAGDIMQVPNDLRSIGSMQIFYVDNNHNEIHPVLVDAQLEITFNYRREYVRVFGEDSLAWLHGKVAKRTIKRLQKGVKLLGTHRADNYWQPTPGNAGYWLRVMLRWARLHPDAVWEVHG